MSKPKAEDHHPIIQPFITSQMEMASYIDLEAIEQGGSDSDLMVLVGSEQDNKNESDSSFTTQHGLKDIGEHTNGTATRATSKRLQTHDTSTNKHLSGPQRITNKKINQEETTQSKSLTSQSTALMTSVSQNSISTIKRRDDRSTTEGLEENDRDIYLEAKNKRAQEKQVEQAALLRAQQAVMRPNSASAATDQDTLLICTPVDELVIQFRSLVIWAWKLKWWLLLGAILGGSAGGGAGATVLRTHTSYAMMRVLTTQHENPLGDFTREAIRYYHSPTNSFPSDALVVESLKRLDGVEPSAKEVYKYRKALDILDFGRDVYEVSFRHNDRNRALAFLKTHIQVYREHEQGRNLGALQREVDRLESTLHKVERRMEATEDKIRIFKAEHAEALPEFARENLSHLHASENKVAELEALALDIRIERNHLVARLKEEPEFLETENEEQQETTAMPEGLTSLRQQIAGLRAGGLSDNHPRLKRLLAEEGFLKKQIEKDREQAALNPVTLTATVPNELYLQLKANLNKIDIGAEQTQRQLEEARQEVIKAKEVVNRIPVLEQRFAMLSRGQDSDLESFEQIKIVLEQAELQLQLEMDAAGTRMELFNPPRLRFASDAVFVAITTIAGILAGMIFVGSLSTVLTLRRLVWPEGVSSGSAR